MGRRARRAVTLSALTSVPIAFLLLIWSCSSFEGGPGGAGTSSGDSAPTNDGGGGPPSPLPDSGGPTADGQAVVDAAIDVGPRRIECSGLECKGELNEICCVYRDGGAANLYGECTIGTSLADCEPPAGQIRFAFAECDDETDCASPLICCHTFNGNNNICGLGITAGRCVAKDKCPLCDSVPNPDGGPSRIPCDERKPGNPCPPGYQCSVPPIPNSVVARSYCVK